MDWNLKTPAEWDWENLAMLSGKTVEIPRQVQLSSNEIEGKGVENGSLYSPAGAAFSISDLGCRSTSKSSIGASADSSLKEGVKTFNPFDGLPKDCTLKDEIVGEKDNRNYSTLGPAVNSVEPMIGLKLGKRIYFEDICATGTNKTTSFSVISTSSALPTKRSRASYHSTPTPRCQVEGCNLDLKSAKDYHRRHRICENHSKSPRVTVAGLERRFCQQCSRFHDLSEFDDKKRSCRRRLSDHNARRRRPRPEAIQFHPARHSSSLYEGRQQVLLNRLPSQVSHPTWHNACNFEITECGDSFSMPAKTASFYRQPLMSSDELPNSNSMLQFDSDRMLSFQSTPPRVLNHDLAPSAFTSNLDAAPDLRRALSLLSTNNSWGLNEPESTSLKQFIHVNQSSVPQQLMHAEPQFTELAPSQYLRVKPPPAVSRVHFLDSNSSGSSQFQESQLRKAPEVGGCFYPNQTNC